MFLSEILRTNPPAPYSMRLVREPLEAAMQPGTGGDVWVQADLGNVTVPSGYLLVYGLGGSLSEASCYENPKEFQWERFQNQSLTESSAFGGGPRLCPGRFLAAEAAQRLLTAVLGKDGFSWKLKEGQDLRQEYIPGLFPVDGLIVEIS
eukprot:s2105_g1.t1